MKSLKLGILSVIFSAGVLLAFVFQTVPVWTVTSAALLSLVGSLLAISLGVGKDSRQAKLGLKLGILALLGLVGAFIWFMALTWSTALIHNL